MTEVEAAEKMREACARECEKMSEASGIISAFLTDVEKHRTEAARETAGILANGIRALDVKEIIGE